MSASHGDVGVADHDTTDSIVSATSDSVGTAACTENALLDGAAIYIDIGITEHVTIITGTVNRAFYVRASCFTILTDGNISITSVRKAVGVTVMSVVDTQSRTEHIAVSIAVVADGSVGDDDFSASRVLDERVGSDLTQVISTNRCNGAAAVNVVQHATAFDFDFGIAVHTA